MGRAIKLAAVFTAISCISIFIGCSKDDKTTNPNTNVPSVSITVGSHQPEFPALGATYSSNYHWLIIGFDQGQFGAYPIAVISIVNADSVGVGNPVDCSVNVVIDTTMQFICGGLADNDSALALATFNRLELQSGGFVSGDVIGRAERMGHPEDGLSNLQIHFTNIPVL